MTNGHRNVSSHMNQEQVLHFSWLLHKTYFVLKHYMYNWIYVFHIEIGEAAVVHLLCNVAHDNLINFPQLFSNIDL